MERVMGIEPTSRAWEAHVLPLYDTRVKGRGVWQIGRQGARVEDRGCGRAGTARTLSEHGWAG